MERLRISRRSAVLAVAVLGAVLLLMRVAAAAERVLGWVLVAAVLAGLVHPLVARLQRRMPRGAAVMIVMTGLVGVLGVVGYGLVDDVMSETRRLQEVAPARVREIEESPRFGEAARELELAERTERLLEDLPDRLRGGEPAEALRAAATRGVAYLTTGILTIFLLLHGPRILLAASRQFTREDRRHRVEALSYRVYMRSFAYARSTVAIAAAAGLFAYVAARVANVPAPVPLALWVSLWDLVPIGGALVGALPIVTMAAVSSGPRAAGLLIVFVAYQLVENLIVQRRVEARSIRVGPFLTLGAGLIGFELSGVAGALLAVLATVIAVTVADELAPGGTLGASSEEGQPSPEAPRGSSPNGPESPAPEPADAAPRH